jgi:3'-5' exonuclease
MNQPSNEIKYLLFDVESVPDGESIAMTRYPGANLSPKEAIRKFRFELLAESGRDFVPYTYHVPVAVVIAKIREDLQSG